jgi:hypothetical protein
MPVRTYPDPESSNELNGTHNGQEDSEDYDTPDASMTQLEDDEFPDYFSELNGRLFPSALISLTPYPFPVDTPEQEVRY